MDKETLLQMTPKEIEAFLNNTLTNLEFESESNTEVKGMMIDTAKQRFDDTVKVSTIYYTNKELSMIVDRLYLQFDVTSKKTGKTIQVSRLKSKDVKKVGKFKLKDISMSFHIPSFVADEVEYSVKRDSTYTCSFASVSLNHLDIKLIQMIDKNLLINEIQKQNDDCKDFRKAVVLNLAQPKIKQDYFSKDFNQEKWDHILKKTEEVNKHLIDEIINKMLLSITCD
jgi:hypothetical protein